MIRQTLAISVLLAVQSPAYASVTAVSDSGFVVGETLESASPPGLVWANLIKPFRWWSKEHTWSGDAANLSFDPVAGGCWCEKLPKTDGQQAGGVQHMRVVMIDPGKLLRLSGALGPLQGEAANGTLTVRVEPKGTGSTIRWEYVLGGYMRNKPAEIAPLVDQVIGAQFKSLAALPG